MRIVLHAKISNHQYFAAYDIGSALTDINAGDRAQT